MRPAPSVLVEQLPREVSLPHLLLAGPDVFARSAVQDEGLEILRQIRNELGDLTSRVSVLDGTPSRSSPSACRPASSTEVGLDAPPPLNHSRVSF